MKGWSVSLLALVAMVVPAQAQSTVKPAIVYANGGKFDKSFNEGVSNGAKKFTDETKIAVADFEPSNETQFEQAQRRFAQRGNDPIIAVGFSQAVALEKVAKEFPNTHFTIIDSVVEPAQRAVGACSRSMRARSWSACWRRWRRRAARSASSAAWTSR